MWNCIGLVIQKPKPIKQFEDFVVSIIYDTLLFNLELKADTTYGNNSEIP